MVRMFQNLKWLAPAPLNQPHLLLVERAFETTGYVCLLEGQAFEANISFNHANVVLGCCGFAILCQNQGIQQKLCRKAQKLHVV